ncbi:MAG: molybdenum cofactor guanylyltransferase, partial [Armatimonadetes bacterium]|nr:molybdenum cofactor guanylyltransferase [Armatimonadota bacterium]
RTLSQVCDEIVVPGALPLPPASRWRCVPDAAGAEGPIAGLIAGLEAAASPIAVVLACDLPLVPVALLRFLADRCAEGYLAVVPFAMEHFHSLCAAYSRALLPAMIEWVRSGRYSTCDLLRTLDDGVCVVDEGQLRQFGDPSIILLNVNSPADLERARELLPLLGS